MAQSLSNTYFRQHFLYKITDAQRQFELFVHKLLDLREHSSILTNGRYDFAEIRDLQFNCVCLLHLTALFALCVLILAISSTRAEMRQNQQE